MVRGGMPPRETKNMKIGFKPDGSLSAIADFPDEARILQRRRPPREVSDQGSRSPRALKDKSKSRLGADEAVTPSTGVHVGALS